MSNELRIKSYELRVLCKQSGIADQSALPIKNYKLRIKQASIRMVILNS